MIISRTATKPYRFPSHWLSEDASNLGRDQVEDIAKDAVNRSTCDLAQSPGHIEAICHDYLAALAELRALRSPETSSGVPSVVVDSRPDFDEETTVFDVNVPGVSP